MLLWYAFVGIVLMPFAFLVVIEVLCLGMRLLAWTVDPAVRRARGFLATLLDREPPQPLPPPRQPWELDWETAAAAWMERRSKERSALPSSSHREPGLLA